MVERARSDPVCRPCCQRPRHVDILRLGREPASPRNRGLCRGSDLGAAITTVGFAETQWLALLMLAVGGAADFVSAVLRTTILLAATPDSWRGSSIGNRGRQVAGTPALGYSRVGGCGDCLVAQADPARRRSHHAPRLTLPTIPSVIAVAVFCVTYDGVGKRAQRAAFSMIIAYTALSVALVVGLRRVLAPTTPAPSPLARALAFAASGLLLLLGVVGLLSVAESLLAASLWSALALGSLTYAVGVVAGASVGNWLRIGGWLLIAASMAVPSTLTLAAVVAAPLVRTFESARHQPRLERRPVTVPPPTS